MKKIKRARCIAYILLILISIAMLFPFFWMVRSAFMTNREIMTTPIQWLPSHYDLENFKKAFERAPFGKYFINSAIIVLINMVGCILSSSFIAFGFSRLRFPGRKLWFALLLSTMMIPQTVLMIPQFLIWQSVGAYNTFIPLTVPCFFGNAFNVFLVRQFYAGIPKEYDEAARTDGADEIRTFALILVPMLKPVLTVVALFNFTGVWNDFLWPTIVFNDINRMPITAGLQLMRGPYKTFDMGVILAAAIIAIVPTFIIYLFSQKYFLSSLSLGAGIKG